MTCVQPWSAWTVPVWLLCFIGCSGEEPNGRDVFYLTNGTYTVEVGAFVIPFFDGESLTGAAAIEAMGVELPRIASATQVEVEFNSAARAVIFRYSLNGVPHEDRLRVKGHRYRMMGDFDYFFKDDPTR